MTKTTRILVIGGDPAVGESVEGALAGKGYTVTAAGSWEEAQDKLNSETVDVVFADVEGSDASGPELAERVRACRPGLRIVIVSGRDPEDSEKQALSVRAPGAGILRKPLSPREIEDLAEKGRLEEAGSSAPPASTGPMPVHHVRAAGTVLRDIALFIAAPFVSLAYLFVFPLVGLGVLIWMGARALTRRKVTDGEAGLKVVD